MDLRASKQGVVGGRLDKIRFGLPQKREFAVHWCYFSYGGDFDFENEKWTRNSTWVEYLHFKISSYTCIQKNMSETSTLGLGINPFIYVFEDTKKKVKLAYTYKSTQDCSSESWSILSSHKENLLGMMIWAATMLLRNHVFFLCLIKSENQRLKLLLHSISMWSIRHQDCLTCGSGSNVLWVDPQRKSKTSWNLGN